MKARKQIELELQGQQTNDPLPVSEETNTRALLAILNVSVIQTQILLDIRDLLKKK